MTRLNSVDFELLNTLVFSPTLGSDGVWDRCGKLRVSSTVAVTDITYRTLRRCCILRSMCMWCVRKFY